MGRHVLAPLAERGWEVHAVSRGGSPGTRAVDLLDGDAGERLAAEVRPTHLLHLAWDVEHGRFWDSPENARWERASVRLAEAFAAAGGRRFVGAGTCAEYSWNGDGLLSERTTPTAPQTEYGRAKDAVRQAADAVVPSMAWGRIFFLFGPDEDARRLVASAARAIVAGQPARISHGRQVRDFLHAADAAAAFVALLESDVEGPVNVGSGEGIAIRHLVGRLAAIAGRPELVEVDAVRAPPDDPPLLVADATRLRDEVGWAPRRTLDERLAETLDWWRRADAPGP